jgi:hypothetical protein
VPLLLALIGSREWQHLPQGFTDAMRRLPCQDGLASLSQSAARIGMLAFCGQPSVPSGLPLLDLENVPFH